MKPWPSARESVRLFPVLEGKYRMPGQWRMLVTASKQPGIRVIGIVGDRLLDERALAEMEREGLVRFTDDTITRPLAGPNVYLTEAGEAELKKAREMGTSVGFYGVL